MTAEEATKAVAVIAARKLAMLRGQVWQVFDKGLVWNAKIFTGPVRNLFPLLGYDERKQGINIFIPVHLAEVEAFLAKPLPGDNAVCKQIASAFLN